MGDQHRGAVVTGQHAAQHLAHRGGRSDVQSGQRLVEQQHVGFGGKRSGQRHPLSLPAGQLPRHPVGEVGRIDLGEPMCRRRTGTARGERHIAGDAQVRKQQRVLEQQADAAIVGGDVNSRRGVGQHALSDAHDTAVRVHQPRDHVQGRRLARAVGAEHGQHLAGGDVEFDVDAAIFDDGLQRNLGHSRATRHWRPATGGCPVRRRQRRPPRRAAATVRRPRRRRFRAAGRSPTAAFG